MDFTEIKIYESVTPHSRIPGVNVLNYSQAYKDLAAMAYGAGDVNPIVQQNARIAINRELDKVINIIRPEQDIYLRYLAETETLPTDVLPTYFLRERVATEVDYLNTQDDSLLRTSIVPGQKFSIVPEHYAETAQWARFDYFADLKPRDEALAQLKLTIDVARTRHWWTLAKKSIASVSATQTTGYGASFSIAGFKSLISIFTDNGYGQALKQVHVIMNSEQYDQLFADCIAKAYPLSELEKMVAMIHVVPPRPSTKNQYAISIGDATEVAGGDTEGQRVYAFLPMDYSKEFIIETGGKPVYFEDYVPNNAGWEMGVKGMQRVSRLIVDRVKAAYAYKSY